MKLESISLELRPRDAYEATDLGARLLQRHAARVYRPWAVFMVPIMLVCISTITIAPWLGALAIWWLKPLYDRLVLFVLSRAVFGQQVTVADVARHWREWAGRSLFAALTWRRIDFARAFVLPLDLLERLKGKPRRLRNKVLQKNARSAAVLTQVAYIHIESIFYLSMLMLVYLFMPNNVAVDLSPWFFGEGVPLWWSAVTCGFYIVALSLAEPAYVASGFVLYLNRRVELEAWDIELALRRGLSELESNSVAPTGTHALRRAA
jgi:hypothetical protein